MSIQGRHVTVFAAVMAAVLVLRWDAFWTAFSSPAIDAWIATRFVLASVVGCVAFRAWQTWWQGGSGGKDGSGETETASRGRGPYRIAMRRFGENRLALIALYVILALCLVAILAPILAPCALLSIV